MFLGVLYLWCPMLFVFLVHAETDVSDPCPADFEYASKKININELCKENACIVKCCPENTSLFINLQTNETSCDDNFNLTHEYNVTGLDDFPELSIYDNNIKREIIKTDKKMSQFIHIYTDNFIFINSCVNYEVTSVYEPPAHEHYILENGNLVIRRINYFNQWSEFSPGTFCVEHQVVLSDDGNVSSELMMRYIPDDNSENDINQIKKNVGFVYGLLVSCVFLLLVLAVYAVLPELRNLAGLMLMAYVTTLLTAFIFRAVLILASENESLNTCIFIGFAQYYTILASFTWMNVMSFDIWWSMRGFRKVRGTDRRSMLVKLGWYGLYGWGAPLLPVLFMVIVENLDLTHMPDFVTPHYSDENYCFMQEDERQLYMNGPILITTCINITLFLMTAYNIWRIKRGVSQHSAEDSRRNKKDESRFGIYLKLSLVMGITWILEVVSSIYKTHSVWWYIPDTFNSLIGLFIFIIFVCKKKIVVLLCKRFSINNDLVIKLQSMESTGTSSARLSDKATDKKSTSSRN